MRSIPRGPKKIEAPFSDGPSVKTPTYQGKAPKAKETIDRPPLPVSGKGSPPGFSGGKGNNAGGRFGKGGWQAKSRRAALNFGKTSEQEEESKRKQAQMALKKKSVGKRIQSLKKGPNEKQSQLLGE